ncbi:hypothetical protein ACTFIW_007317 [Dictyostelium discoideum]
MGVMADLTTSMDHQVMLHQVATIPSLQTVPTTVFRRIRSKLTMLFTTYFVLVVHNNIVQINNEFASSFDIYTTFPSSYFPSNILYLSIDSENLIVEFCKNIEVSWLFSFWFNINNTQKPILYMVATAPYLFLFYNVKVVIKF